MPGPRTILITGATDGLGRALAHRLTGDGATVLLHGRDQGKLDRTAAEIRDTHGDGRTHTLRADLADLAQVRGLAAETRQATDRLDVFVSNAGHPATYMPTKIVLAEAGSSIDTLDTGVAATYRLVSDPALDGVTGQFFNKTNATF